MMPGLSRGAPHNYAHRFPVPGGGSSLLSGADANRLDFAGVNSFNDNVLLANFLLPGDVPNGGGED